MIKIIYRACDLVNSVHGGSHCRPMNLSKKDIISISSLSLKDCLKDIQHEFYIIGDRVSEQTKLSLIENLNPKNVYFHTNELGNMGVFLESSKLAMTFDDNDIIFFAEDDYLYDSSVFYTRLKDFIDFADLNISLPWFIHPTDYPDQYSHFLSRNYIHQTKSGYWREVSHTTGSFICYKKYYKMFNTFIDECYLNRSADQGMSSLFKDKALCYSPIPSIGTHLHLGTMPEYVNWNSLILKYLIK